MFVHVPLASSALMASSLLFIETFRKYVHSVLLGTTDFHVKCPLCSLEETYIVEWGTSGPLKKATLLRLLPSLSSIRLADTEYSLVIVCCSKLFLAIYVFNL